MGRFWLFAVAIIFAAAGALAVLILRPASAPVTKDQGPIGATIAVDPAATIAAQSGGTVVAQLTSPVHLNDMLATGPDGSIRVQFTDSTFFSLGHNAAVKVDTYVYDPEHDSSGMLIGVQRGAFRFVSGRSLHPGDKPVVNTPVAAIGVRGTGFDVVIGPQAEALFRRIDPRFVPDGGDTETATLILLTEGAIDVDGSGQKIALETPGQVVYFRRRGEPPIGPLMAWTSVRGEIASLVSPPELGAEPARSPRETIMVPPVEPSPSPSATVVVPVPSPSAAVKPVPSPSPSPTARPTATPTPRVTPKPTPSPRFTPKPTPMPRVTPKPTPTPTPRFTPRPTPTPRFTPRPTPTPRLTPRPTPTARFTPKPTPTATPTPRPTRVPLTNVPRTKPTASPTPVKR